MISDLRGSAAPEPPPPAAGRPPPAFPREYFQRALGRGRISHAYLFLGPPGSGRLRFALEVARAVFCPEAAPCGACPSCRAIEHGNHPGVHRYGESGTVEIADVRDLSNRVHLRRSDFLVAIIENADRMTVPAANALLKTLEEPSGAALLILVAQSSGVLLPTIVSRCHRIPFPAPPPALAAGPPFPRLEEPALPGFLAENDPREWLTANFPEAEGLRDEVRALLEALLRLDRGRWSPPGATGGGLPAADPGADRIETILELIEDLERNVNPDLVLEAAFDLIRSPA